MFHFQRFHRSAKIKFAVKRKRSALCPSSDVMNPKRRATPSEDSPLAQLFNDVGIKELVREVKGWDELVAKGKKFLISLQGLMNNSPEESANDIYDEARQVWEYELTLTSACTYAIDKESSLRDKLVFYSNCDAPTQRMASMMKDPWLEYILGDRVLGLKKSNAFIRGFLSILIAYWNMKDILDKYKLGEYGLPPTSPYIPPINVKSDSVIYVIHHVDDFQNLREVLEFKYGSDPDLVASLFEQISNYQVNGMDLSNLWTWTPWKRAMISVRVRSEGSSPLSLCQTFTFQALPAKNDGILFI